VSAQALSELNREFVKLGYHRKCTGKILFELFFMVTLMVGGIFVFLLYDSLLVKLFALWFSTLGLFAITTNTHTAAHYATSNKWWVNWTLQILGYSYLIGMSAAYWRHKHAVVHHPTPNVIGLDDDIDLMPYFHFNEEDWARAGRWGRIYQKYQWLLFPFSINFNGLNLQFAGWRYLWSVMRDPKQRRWIHWVDLSVLFLHHASFWALPMLFFNPWNVLGFYLLRQALLGWSIFIVFAPAHFPAEALFLSSGNQDRATYLKNRDFVLLQCATTLNIKTTWFGNLFCGGTDYQIEHHLFPGISHPYLVKMAPLVKSWCEEHGYPYRTVTFTTGIWKSWMSLKKPKPVHATAEVLRVMAEAARANFIRQDDMQEHDLLGGDPAKALADATA
jgi:linoleoyl-CoA desaturase